MQEKKEIDRALAVQTKSCQVSIILKMMSTSEEDSTFEFDTGSETTNGDQ